MLSKTQYLKEWRLKNADRVRAHAAADADKRLRRKYGISTRERNRILRAQGYRCAGCRRPKSGHWHTDHCHRTMRVRGVLCMPCNVALGFAKDMPSTLRRLADYLEK